MLRIVGGGRGSAYSRGGGRAPEDWRARPKADCDVRSGYRGGWGAIAGARGEGRGKAGHPRDQVGSEGASTLPAGLLPHPAGGDLPRVSIPSRGPSRSPSPPCTTRHSALRRLSARRCSEQCRVQRLDSSRDSIVPGVHTLSTARHLAWILPLSQ